LADFKLGEVTPADHSGRLIWIDHGVPPVEELETDCLAKYATTW
jgi:hypothetical protein